MNKISLLTPLTLALFFIACGSDSGNSSSAKMDAEEHKIEDKSISGVSQKGPFVKGSTVTAYELDGSKSLLQTGRSFSGTISQDDGRFNMSNVSLQSSFVRLSVNGYYRNEVTGERSASPITLNAVTDLYARNTVNVNLLTHLEYDRVAQLLREGGGTLDIKKVKKQAEKEIFNAFHFDVSDFGYSEDLDVFGKTEADAALLAISILLQGDRSEAELTELLAELSSDFEDGKWDDAEKKAEIADWAFENEFQRKLADYRSNVEGWGLSTTVPDFEKYVHDFWITEKLGSCNVDNEGKIGKVSSQNFEGVVITCSNGKWVWSIQGELVDDRDGQRYRTVKIGSQTWMAENLNYKVESSVCPDNQDSNCTKYGRLYTWGTAVGKSESDCPPDEKCSLPSGNIQGVCPSGWHLPTKAEWDTLITSVGRKLTIASNALKSTNGWPLSDGWVSNGGYGYSMATKGESSACDGCWDVDGWDVYSFSALPAGDNFSYIGGHAFFWSSTECDFGDFYEEKWRCAYSFYLNYMNTSAATIAKHQRGIGLGKDSKLYGVSVRCLQD